ncbi:MAG: FISUMP domain-containing protein [Ferruginibacter sp.]
MKRSYIFLLAFIFFSCKKNNKAEVENFSSYFSDTSSNKPTGLVPSSISDLQSIPFAEDIDTSLIPSVERVTSPRSWNIDAPPSVEQRKTYNSCAGWAVGYGMMSCEYKIIEGQSNYNGTEKIFSPDYIWNQLNNGQNNGISLSKAMKLVKDQGCCKWTYMPGNGSLNDQPSIIARTNAESYTISQIIRFKTVNINMIKIYLHNNYSIPFGAEIDKGFKTGYDIISFKKLADGRLIWVNKSVDPTSLVEYHAMLICGYDDDINAFKVLNSWGPGWGNDGFIWIDYDFLSEIILMNDNLNQPEMFAAYIGKPYPFAIIGNQTWMQKNLNVIRYKNGDAIPQISDQTQWQNATTGAWCYFNNDPLSEKKYGKLYNGFAVRDPRGLAPDGWHIPVDDEWDMLRDKLDGQLNAGGKMKEISSLWTAPNTGANNISDFTALPGGYRDGSGQFFLEHTGAYWWSASQINSNSNSGRGVLYNDKSLINYYFGLNRGESIRCVKD